MVTHSPNMAKRAKRIVALRDGEIVDEVELGEKQPVC
jgi:predicted ABC-type transport system involved in lysophospholipase L1 biosynthesis ATPase subunit